jgi:alpha-amylase/alpha-mannosidase (GH57 family)
MTLLKACLRANEDRLVKRFRPYQRLANIVNALGSIDEALGYLDDRFLADCLVWYHLAWMGETVRRQDSRIKRLQDKARDFSYQDRRLLMEVIGELMAGVLPRYKTLAANEQIELSVTPYAHPIVPLLIDLQSAREAMPDVHLPVLDGYPDGDARARWHVDEGKRVFEKYFGMQPDGCWPSEGGVSPATLKLLGDAGFKWTATGEQVLRNSLEHSELVRDLPKEQGLHRPYHLPGQRIACFFRDDGLSDLLGFSYSDWHADDAVANLIHHLCNIREACGDHPETVVSIILDGENAWEYYPENGYYFLRALYEKLAAHPDMELTTFSHCLSQGVEAQELPHMVSGSWVYGTFSTWIGDRDKNHAWEMLGEAKHRYDTVVSAGELGQDQHQAAQKQLAICEGSDWFWWFGDYNPAESVADFDRLYRLHLTKLYQLLGEKPPDYLGHAFSHGGGEQQRGGVMRRGKE